MGTVLHWAEVSVERIIVKAIAAYEKASLCFPSEYFGARSIVIVHPCHIAMRHNVLRGANNRENSTQDLRGLFKL